MKNENENKNFVGMANCFICGKVKYLVLDKRMKKTLNPQAVYEREPCDNCKEIMKQGVLFIGVRDGEQDKENPYRTGQIIGIKEEAVKKMSILISLQEQILKSRVCFIEETALKRLGLLKQDGSLKYKKDKVKGGVQNGLE